MLWARLNDDPKCLGSVLQPPPPPYLHLRHVDRFVDEDPSGGLVARRDRDGALVSDVACGVRIKVGNVQAHQ